jgi:hypothetical protein
MNAANPVISIGFFGRSGQHGELDVVLAQCLGEANQDCVVTKISAAKIACKEEPGAQN